jgi:hypothetical protein
MHLETLTKIINSLPDLLLEEGVKQEDVVSYIKEAELYDTMTESNGLLYTVRIRNVIMIQFNQNGKFLRSSTRW